MDPETSVMDRIELNSIGTLTRGGGRGEAGGGRRKRERERERKRGEGLEGGVRAESPLMNHELINDLATGWNET